MLAVVVKNFILMLLIIMIFHFMIKNYEADLIVHRRMSKTPSQGCDKDARKPLPAPVKNDLAPVPSSPSPPSSPTVKHNVAKNPAPQDESITTIVNDSANIEPKLLPREAIEELYDFVFNDKEQSDDHLDSYFKEKLTNENLDQGCDVLCEDQKKNDVKNFCVNNVDSVFKKDRDSKPVMKEHKTQGVLGTDTKKTQQGFQILYEYNDEPSDNLMGFETFESNYMTL